MEEEIKFHISYEDRVMYSYNKTNEMHQIFKFIFRIVLYMFGIGILIPLASSQYNLNDIYLLLCIQYLTSDDGHKTCPKYVEFYSKNKLEKFVHLFGFTIKIYHDARPSECQNRLMPSGIINNTILVLCRSEIFQASKGHPRVRLRLAFPQQDNQNMYQM
jgi:hypothetical protein